MRRIRTQLSSNKLGRVHTKKKFSQHPGIAWNNVFTLKEVRLDEPSELMHTRWRWREQKIDVRGPSEA